MGTDSEQKLLKHFVKIIYNKNKDLYYILYDVKTRVLNIFSMEK